MQSSRANADRIFLHFSVGLALDLKILGSVERLRPGLPGIQSENATFGWRFCFDR